MFAAPLFERHQVMVVGVRVGFRVFYLHGDAVARGSDETLLTLLPCYYMYIQLQPAPQNSILYPISYIRPVSVATALDVHTLR